MYAKTANLFVTKTDEKSKIKVVKMTPAKLKLMERASKIMLLMGR